MVSLMGLLAKEAADSNDRRRAHAGALVNFPIWKIGFVEQTSDVPALRHRSELRRSAEIKKQSPHVVAVARRQQRIAKIIGEEVDVAGRCDRVRRGSHCRAFRYYVLKR